MSAWHWSSSRVLPYSLLMDQIDEGDQQLALIARRRNVLRLQADSGHRRGRERE
ncbi:endonuclease/exonuclease/phosphatase family protein [Sesbania bispinosa]|nr:endonuclease/exonuclease/phosphatase family protein [Sesbania bispinosa]